jgi:hypothetical protein
MVEKRRRALSIIGIASSGLTDLSTNHDYYLAQVFEEDLE